MRDDVQKSSQESPKWYMVDIRFVRRLPHMVPLGFLQHIAALPPPSTSTDTTSEMESVSVVPSFVSPAAAANIAAMQLLSRGRLSVQAVEQDAYDIIVRLGDDGHGWDPSQKKKPKAAPKAKTGKKASTSKAAPQSSAEAGALDDEDNNAKSESLPQSGSHSRVQRYVMPFPAVTIVAATNPEGFVQEAPVTPKIGGQQIFPAQNQLQKSEERVVYPTV